MIAKLPMLCAVSVCLASPLGFAGMERFWANKEDQKTVAFHTLGCRLNMAETGQIAQGFVDRGYKVVSFGDHADVTFLNTCTVTD